MLRINSVFDYNYFLINEEDVEKENNHHLTNNNSIINKYNPNDLLNFLNPSVKKETGVEKKIIENPCSSTDPLVSRKRQASSLIEFSSKRRQIEGEEKESKELTSIESVAKTSSSIFDETEMEQKRFFTDQEPKGWFLAYRDKNQKVQFAFPFDLQDTQRLIYVFKNKVKQCFLIGETGTGLRQRCARYTSWINQKGSEDQVKSVRKKAFLKDMKEHPEHFEVGILYALRPQEDLKRFEKAFIQYKEQVWDLYNDNGGGGGGLAHAEESPVVYAVPKPGTAPYTPKKYYRYKREGVKIRPQFSPSFKDRIRKSKKRQVGSFTFPYVIRRLDTSRRYIGVTNNPERRAYEHAYEAEYKDPLNEKYDPTHGGGCIHLALAEDPEKFAIGVLPVQLAEDIEPERLSNFVLLQGRAELERYTIQVKESLVTQQGFNCNGGGGGPVPMSQ